MSHSQPLYRPTRRAQVRADTTAAIKAAALEQVRACGPEALSLRAVARELGMSSPGLYRYYRGRDELLTALIADAYGALATALTRARDEAGESLRQRFAATCSAYYEWAEDHPTDFGLIFGTPVPGYQAPVDGPTTAAAERFSAVFFDLLRQRPKAHPAGSRPELLQAAEIWSRLHGVTALSVAGHLMPRRLTADDRKVLYESVVDRCCDDLRL